MDFEVTKTRKRPRKKTIPTINEVEENDVRDKIERLITCVLSGNSKQYLGKEYTEQQINEMDGNYINILPNRYKSVLRAQMTESLGKSVINLYSNVACSVLGIGNQQALSDDLECYPFLNTAMQRFTCDLYYRLDNTRKMSAKCLLILSVEMIFYFDGFANGQINKIS